LPLLCLLVTWSFPIAGWSETTDVDHNGHVQEQEEEAEEEKHHRGFFSRVEIGVGYAALFADGVMPPAPGLKRIEDPFHQTPTVSLAFDFGGGLLNNLALHAGFLIEKPILRYDGPDKMAFNILGVGIGLTYYFMPYDLFLSGRFRYAGLFVFLPEVVCDRYFKDKYEVYGGPGFSLTFGKEWFGGNKGGVGLGAVLNYYHFISDSIVFDYFSMLLALTVSRF